MLDDAAFDVEAWLAEEIATEFARAEGRGVRQRQRGQPAQGLPGAPVSAPAGTARGRSGRCSSSRPASPAAFPASNPQDKLIDLVQALAAALPAGRGVRDELGDRGAHPQVQDRDGAFLWQPGLVAGQPDTLLGYPVVEAEDMPDVAADALSIAFGNFRAGYLIAERTETQILRDPFTNKPFVHFYATQADRRAGDELRGDQAAEVRGLNAGPCRHSGGSRNP